MRLVSYAAAHGPAVGIVRGDAVTPVPGTDMLALIAAVKHLARRCHWPG
jgi:hypothetical protein